MFLEAKRIKHQQVQTHQPRAGLVRNKVAVSCVREPTDAKCGHRQLSVYDRKRFHVEPEQTKVAFEAVRDDAREARIRRRLEDVSERAAQPLPGNLTGIDRDGPIAKHYGPRVVQPKTMIGMRMGEEDCGYMLEPDAKRLLAKIRRSVYENILAVVFDQDRSTETLIARVIRQTGVALAAHRRDADRCARAQKTDLHRARETATNCIRRSASMFSRRTSSSRVRLPLVFV